MSRDFDDFPTYDAIIQDEIYLSSIWASFMATFVETLRNYMSSSGIFVPLLTISQRDAIGSPQEGQLIYVSDGNAQLPRTAQLQIWQVVAGIGQWTIIV